MSAVPAGSQPKAAAASDAATRIFLSYSRKDGTFAGSLREDLQAAGVHVLRDIDDTLPGEEWWRRLQALIGEADTVVFVLSPHSIASKVCREEVAYAQQLAKRIFPAVLADVDWSAVPEGLARIHSVFFTEEAMRKERVADLLAALRTDIGWVREHTRLGELARRWQEQGRPNGMVLRGRDIAEAERWLAARLQTAPAITPAHHEFIAASRRAAVRRQRWWVGGSIAVAVLALGLAAWAELNRREAGRQEAIAVENEKVAREQRDAALKTQSLFLASLSVEQTDAGNAATGVALALEALPRNEDSSPRPFVRQAEAALYGALAGLHEEAVLAGHERAVTSVAYSPDGKLIVTGSWDKTAIVWDAVSHARLRSLAGHKDILTAVGFSPDGRLIATASRDRTVKIWDVETGKLVTTLEGHTGEVTSVGFSPQGNRIVSGSKDRTARIWDLASFALVGRVDVAKDISAVTFMPGGTRISIAETDGTVEVWDAAGKARLSTIKLSSPIFSMRASAKGDRLLIAAGGKVEIWDIAKQKQTLEVDLGGGWVRSAVFTAGEASIVTADDVERISVFDAKSGRRLAEFKGHGHNVTSVALSSDGTRIVSGSWDATARVWVLESPLLRKWDDPELTSIDDVRFSSDGARFLDISGHGRINVWETDSPAVPVVLDDHTSIITSVEFSADGTKVLTASWDKAAVLWDVKSGTALMRLEHGARLCCARLSGDAGIVATGSDEGNVRLWDARSGTVMREWQAHDKPVSQLLLSADASRVVSLAGDGRGTLWKAADGAPIAVFGDKSRQAIAAIMLDDGSRFAVAFDTGPVEIRDSATGGVVRTLAVAGDRAVVQIFAAADGRLVAAVDAEGLVTFWDGADGAELGTIEPGTSGYYAVKFARTGRRAMIALDDRVTMVDLDSGGVVAVLPEASRTNAADFSPDGRLVLAGDVGGALRLWRVFPDTKALISYARSVKPRELTPGQRRQFFLE